MRLIVKLVICFLFLQLFPVKTYSQSKEYMLKAGFLEKFARFSEWPQDVKMDTFKITILGKSPFQGALEKMYTSYNIKKKPVSINYISSVDDIDNCHIMFVSKTMSRQLDTIIQKVGSKPILTVGETNGYVNKGVIINFFKTNKGTVHFEISKKNVKESGIKMDILLLNFAELVE